MINRKSSTSLFGGRARGQTAIQPDGTLIKELNGATRIASDPNALRQFEERFDESANYWKKAIRKLAGRARA